MSIVSDNIKKAMKEAGVSQRELEIKTGIPHSAIQRYAAGATDRIPIGRLEKIAVALGTTAQDLLGWIEETPDAKADNERTEEIVKLFNLLPVEHQDLIIAQIKGILSKQ